MQAAAHWKNTLIALSAIQAQLIILLLRASLRQIRRMVRYTKVPLLFRGAIFISTVSGMSTAAVQATAML